MSTTSYTDNNVVYTYTVPVSGTTGTAFVDRSPNATGVINIQSTFVRDSVTYTVTSIGTSAFFGNVLDNVTIPNTVITINNNAFKNTGLSSISIPDSVTTIGDSAFSNNKIETTNIGNNVTTIGANAFIANKLTTITIPDKVVTIGDSAFQNNALNNVTIIGTEVTTIGISAFQGNNLSELFIPVSVTLIGDSAFRTNKLSKVYFFNIPTIDTNAFANNTVSIIAYYVDTSTTAQINSLPTVFSSKTPMTKVEILKYQIQQGVTVEYLLDDNFTLAEMIAADGSADWLLTYYSLQQLVDAGCPVSRLLLGSSVTPLDLFNCGVSIVNLKNADANTRVMLNQFSLADLITVGYTVNELKVASDSTIAPVVTNNNKVTIQKFKLAQASIPQMLTAYNTGTPGLNALLVEYTVSELYNVDNSISIANFKAASANIAQMITAFNTGSTGLNGLLVAGYTVSQLHSADSSISIANFKAAEASISQMLTVFNTGTSGLNGLLSAGYTVSQLYNVDNSISIANFKAANAVISQMETFFNTGPSGLNALLLAGYTVSQLYSVDNSITIDNFYDANANIAQMITAFNTGSVGLKALLVKYSVSELHSANSSISVADFVAANVSISTLISVYKIETNGLKALLEVFTVSEIHIEDNTISISDFKAADADAKQMLNVFNTDSTRLIELLNAGYTSLELKTASESTTAPIVVTNRKVSLQKFKDANVSTVTLLNLYNTSLDGLIDFIQAGYTVAELQTASSSSLVIANSKVTIERLKRASADIKLMLNEYNTDDNGLIDFISAAYTVSELKAASDSTVAPVVISSNKVTVARLKIAQANVLEMLNSYLATELLTNNYRVANLLAAKSNLSLSDFIINNDDDLLWLWDLMNNYSITSLLQYFTVAQLIIASNEKDSNNDFKVTIIAKQALNTKAGTLKSAGALIGEMVAAFSLSYLIIAGYSVAELKTAKLSLTATDFKTAGATAAQMLNSNKFILSELIAVDYRVADLKAADSSITLSDFADAGAPLSDLMNAYLLYDLIHVQPVGYTVAELIVASNQKDSQNNYKVTVTIYQSLDTKAGTLKAASAPIGEMIVAFSLTDLLAADYRVAELTVANSSFTLSDFALAGAHLWDLMNNYTLSELVSLKNNSISVFTVAQFIVASNEKDAGINKVTDVAKQSLDTKAGTLKAAGANIGEMIVAFSLTDLLAADYIVKDLKDGSVLLTISSFKTAGASVAQMMNAYSLFELIHVEPVGYTVLQLINASNEKDSQSNYIVTENAKQALDTKPQTLKAAGALIGQMVGYFSLQTLLSSPLSYTVAELKVVTGVTLASLNTTFVNMGLNLKDRLDKLYNEFSLKNMLTIYTVEELANYSKSESNIADLTVADFKAISNPDVTPSQMVSYFSISELYNGGYSVQYIVTNGKTVQEIIYGGSVPLWAVLNYVGPQLGYYRKNSSDFGLLSITDLMNAVSDTNSNYKSLKVYDFYIGTNPSHPKPNDVPTYVNGSTEVLTRNTDIAEVATLAEMLRIKYFSIQTIIDLGTYSINNNALKNLTVVEFNAATKLDRVWMYENRLSDFIQQFNLSDLINDWTVFELKTKGASENLSPGSSKVVTVQELKFANAPAWDMLNNYTLSELVLNVHNRNKYTSAELVSASKEKVNGVYKVTVVDNRDITLSKLKTAGAFLYDLMNHFDLADLILGGYSVVQLIYESNEMYYDYDTGITKYWVTRIEYQKLGGFLIINGGNLTQAELNTGAATLKQANAPIGEMINAFSLTTLVGAGYGVAELQTANTSFTAENFKEALVPLSEMLNHYKFYNLYNYYTISELKIASESSHVTDVENQTLTIAKFKANNAPIWKMLNAYLLSHLVPYYTAKELIEYSGAYGVNEPNANLTLADLDRVEHLWDLMNSDIHSYLDLLNIGYTVKELYEELQLKDNNNNYKVTRRNYWQEFTNIRSFYYGTIWSQQRSTFLYYLAQLINTYALRDILRVNYDNGPNGEQKGSPIYPIADILDAQAQYGSATTLDELGQPIIASNKEVTPLRLATAIKSFEENTWGSYINDMINYYRYANGTDSIQNALNIMFSQSGLKPKDLLTYYYDNLFDSQNKPTKVIIFKAAAVGTSITSSDIYEIFSIYELLSAYTITEINTIRVNLATPLPILTVDEILNLMALNGDVNNPQPYYNKIRDDLVNLVKNGTYSYSLSHVYSNAANYYNSFRYISASYFKGSSIVGQPITVSQLKNAGAKAEDMLNVYYLDEYYVNSGKEPPEETSLVGLTELLTVYSVSQIAPTVTYFDYNYTDKYALIGFPIRLLKAAGADIKQMLNYFNTLNIYGQTSDTTLQNNTDGLYWLLYFGYTVSELKAASESTTGTIVDNDKKVTIARFHDVSADHKQMLTAYNTDSNGLKALLVNYTVLELKTSSDSVVAPVVPLANKVSIQKFYDAEADVVQMLNVYNTGSVGLAALLVTYTVSELHSASNSPSIADFKAANADYAQMLTAYNTGSVGLAALLVEYTVSQLHSASNSPSIANFKAATASIPQMLTVYNIDTAGLTALLVAGYTVLQLKTASTDVSVHVDNKVTIAKFKLAGADVWQMLNNYILSDLVISVSFSDGYTTRVLVTASTDIRVTVIGNKNISLTTINAAGAPLYDLMNYYTLAQLVAVPISYSVSQLITASKMKDLNNVYKVTVTAYQELDSDAGAVTLKGASALIGQMVVAFSLTQLIKADYRVSVLKTANSAYTISDFKTAVAPLWDMLNDYDIVDLLYNGYTVAELKLASEDPRSTTYSNLNAIRFIEIVRSNKSPPPLDYNGVAADILNNFTLYQVTSNGGWFVSELITYSRDSRVTNAKSNKNLVLTDFKTRSNSPTWDILTNYSLAEMVTAGYTVAELKTTIPYNSVVPFPLNKQVTIASLKAAGSIFSDIINNYTVRELADESSTVGSYTLRQLVETSNSITAVPLVIDSRKVTLARLLALTPLPPLTYLLTYYTTLQLVGGGVPPLDLAKVNPNILEEVVAIGFLVKLKTPQLLSSSVTSSVVALNLNQATGSDVSIDKYSVSYSSNNGRTFTPLAVLMNTTVTPNVPQLGNTLYVSGLQTNKFYSFRIMASSGSVKSSISNTLKNVFVG